MQMNSAKAILELLNNNKVLIGQGEENEDVEVCGSYNGNDCYRLLRRSKTIC